MGKKTTKRLQAPKPSKVAKAMERLKKVERAEEIVDLIYKRIESTWDSSNDCTRLLELKEIIRELE